MSQSNRRPLALALIVVIFIAVAAFLLWRRGGPSAPANTEAPFDRLSARCDAVAVVPRLDVVGGKLATLSRLKLAEFAASSLGYDDVDGLLAALARQAGFDFRSPESLRAAGVALDRPLVIYSPGPSEWPLVAVPVSDAKPLEALLAKYAKDRLQASPRSEVQGEGGTVVTFSRAGADTPVLTLAEADGFFFVGQSVERVREVLRPLATPLAQDETFEKLRAKLGSNDAWFALCREGGRASALNLPYGAGGGLVIGSERIELRAEATLSESQAAHFQSLSGPAGADLLARLDPSAFAAFRFGGDPALLKPVAAALTPRMFQNAVRRARFDVAEEILGNLNPGVAGALRLAPAAQLGMVPQLDPRLTNPFQYVYLQFAGRVRDPQKAQQAMERVAEIAPHFGAQIETRDLAGLKVFTTLYHLGEGASMAVKDDLALITGGPGQMEATLSRLAGTDAPLALGDAAAQKAAAEEGFFLYLDTGRLVRSVQELPDSAYGIGASIIKKAVTRWLEAIGELRTLQLTARTAERTLSGELILTLAPSAPVTPTAASPQKEP